MAADDDDIEFSKSSGVVVIIWVLRVVSLALALTATALWAMHDDAHTDSWFLATYWAGVFTAWNVDFPSSQHSATRRAHVAAANNTRALM